MDFSLNKEQKEIEEKCRRFAEQEIAPRVKQLEDDLSVRMGLFRQMAEENLFLLGIPKNKKTDTVGYLAGLKAIAKADAGIAVAMAVTNMVAEAMVRFGTAEQQLHYLPKIADGTCVPLSFAITEKQAGSDVKAIKTAFKEDPGGSFVLLNGEKQFITNGDISEALIIIARGKWEGEDGISAFVIDRKTEGLSVIKKENKLGLLTANLVTLGFDNCRVPKTALLAKAGEGLKVALASLDSGRLGIAAQAAGIAEAAFESALTFSKERHQFGRAIGENQAIAFKLADMRVKLDAAILMTYRAAWLKDQNFPFSMAAASAKLYGSEICNEIVSDTLQIHGGYGYIKDYPVEKYFRDARVTTLYEGTSEIQRIVIARNL